MFCYALAKGVRLGDLAPSCRESAESAFAALASSRLSLDDYGNAHLSGVCKVAGLGGDPYRDGSYAYYIGEPVGDDDFKGVGPYILAAVELG
jgi:unsaturated rhamnogalacturonyl hydrolase